MRVSQGTRASSFENKQLSYFWPVNPSKLIDYLKKITKSNKGKATGNQIPPQSCYPHLWAQTLSGWLQGERRSWMPEGPLCLSSILWSDFIHSFLSAGRAALVTSVSWAARAATFSSAPAAPRTPSGRPALLWQRAPAPEAAAGWRRAPFHIPMTHVGSSPFVLLQATHPHFLFFSNLSGA